MKNSKRFVTFYPQIIPIFEFCSCAFLVLHRAHQVCGGCRAFSLWIISQKHQVRTKFDDVVSVITTMLDILITGIDRFDAYDLEQMNKYFGIVANDVALISIATAMHWLDFDKLALALTTVYPKETTVAVIGYLPPKILNEQLVTCKSLTESLKSVNGVLKGICFKSAPNGI